MLLSQSYYSNQLPRPWYRHTRKAHLGKATHRTEASIDQNLLFTPSFSPGRSGRKSLRCCAYSSDGVGVMRTLEIRPRCGTSRVREGPDGSGMYYSSVPTCTPEVRLTRSTIFLSSAGVFLLISFATLGLATGKQTKASLVASAAFLPSLLP
jgi:hypothetical protein